MAAAQGAVHSGSDQMVQQGGHVGEEPVDLDLDLLHRRYSS